MPVNICILWIEYFVAFSSNTEFKQVYLQVIVLFIFVAKQKALSWRKTLYLAGKTYHPPTLNMFYLQGIN